MVGNQLKAQRLVARDWPANQVEGSASKKASQLANGRFVSARPVVGEVCGPRRLGLQKEFPIPETHRLKALEVAGAVGLLIPFLSSLAALRLAAVMVGAAMTTQFLLEESPWLPLALLVVAAVIAWARRSSNSILVDILRR